MKTLTVKRGEITYLLYNLTSQRFHELQNNPNELTSYFNHCVQTKLNICEVMNNENSSTSSAGPHSHAPFTASSVNNLNPSTSATGLVQLNSNARSANMKFSFLCGHFSNKNFIYAIKCGKHPWHYFEMKDSASSQHGSLPASIDVLIRGMDKPTPINVNLNEEQTRNYYVDGKFIFNNKELKTSMAINSKENQPKSDKTTNRLIFVSGQSNPLLFLNDFEKCSDLKNDQDKMYKIRHFVDDCHKAEFARLCFTSDWQNVRSVFLKLYSESFVTNKKKALEIEFKKAKSLRSFIERKLSSLSTYTTLSFVNQIEMVMNDLPTEISLLFITNEKMTSNKADILDFCDSIQDLVSTMREKPEAQSTSDLECVQLSNNLESSQLNRMEIAESELSCGEGTSTRAIRKRGPGRPRKNATTTSSITTIQGDSSDYDFMQQMDNTSRSSWSEQ